MLRGRRWLLLLRWREVVLARRVFDSQRKALALMQNVARMAKAPRVLRSRQQLMPFQNRLGSKRASEQLLQRPLLQQPPLQRLSQCSSHATKILETIRCDVKVETMRCEVKVETMRCEVRVETIRCDVKAACCRPAAVFAA
jgi:hypothetical protein